MMAKLFLPFSLTPLPLPFSHAFLEIRFKGWKTNEIEKKIEKKRALEQSPESFLVILGKFQTTTTT